MGIESRAERHSDQATALDRLATMSSILTGLKAKIFPTEERRSNARELVTSLATHIILYAPQEELTEVEQALDDLTRSSHQTEQALCAALRNEFAKAVKLIAAKGVTGTARARLPKRS